MENTFSNSIILKLFVSLPQMWWRVEILADSINMLLLSLHLNKTWQQFNLASVYAISLPSHSYHKAVSQSKGGLILVQVDKSFAYKK